MVKRISIITGICMCLVFGINKTLNADAKKEKARIAREHVEKVKVTHPDKYQSRLEKAGGNTTDCLGCHKDLLEQKKKKTTQPVNPVRNTSPTPEGASFKRGN